MCLINVVLLFINHCVTFKQVQRDRMWTTVMRASLASPAEIQRAQLLLLFKRRQFPYRSFFMSAGVSSAQQHKADKMIFTDFYLSQNIKNIKTVKKKKQSRYRRD